MAYNDLTPEQQSALDPFVQEIEDENSPGEDEEFQSTIQGAVEQALRWREENLDTDQAKATDYYQGEPFGAELPEKRGRSQIVMTTVRDAVQSVIPSLNRIFFGSDRVVEFNPIGPEDMELAAQQTDYINYVIVKENNGYLKLNAAWKDALVRKLGVVKWYWDTTTRVSGFNYSGLTEMEVAAVAKEEGVEFPEDGPIQTGTVDIPVPPPPGSPPGTPPTIEKAPTFSLYVKRTDTSGRAAFDVIPPEEFVWSPNARDVDSAIMVGHTRMVPGDELVAMGVDKSLVKKHQGKGPSRQGGGEALPQARSMDNMTDRDRGRDEQDEDTDSVRFSDIYIRYDRDGDGIAEIRRVQCIGDDYEIVDDECTSEKPFAIFQIDPEPHTFVGLSLADITMDLQKIESAMTRGMLDSLAQHLNPPTEVVEGMVNMKDLLNPEVNRIVRVKQREQMREIPTTFVGKEALPVLQWFEAIEERRTGRSNGAMGLDADTLQSSTKAAVSATLSAAQQRVEQYARMFAETGMKDLYRGLYRLTVQHKDQAEVVRLRGRFVTIDPRVWTAERDVTINVGLGAAPPSERAAYLQSTLAAQQAAYEQGLPIVGLVEIRRTLARLAETAGFSNTSEFWRDITPQQEAEYIQAKQNAPPPPPPPEVLLTAEVTREEIKAKHTEKLLDLRVRAEDIRLKNDRERDKIVRDFVAAILKLGVDIDQQKLQQARQMLDEDLAAKDLILEIGSLIDQQTAATVSQQPTVPPQESTQL